MTKRSIAAISVLALLAACSGGRGTTALPPGAGDASMMRTNARAQGAGALVVRVKVSNNAGHDSPDYVSAASKAMAVKITGPTNVTETVGLVSSARGCVSSAMTLTCTLSVPDLKACPGSHKCYIATVATYDKFNTTTGKIPHSAKELSGVSDVAFNIATGQTVVPIVLQGIPKSVAFVPGATSTLAGTQSGGFIAPKCATAPQHVTIVPVDADGNYIVGPGQPKTTLVSDDPAQLKVLAPVHASPNAYRLAAPKAPLYAFGGHTIHLTATSTAGASSGVTTPATGTFDVTYSGNVCGVITEFALSNTGAEPYYITTGPDGALWFAESLGNKIGRITTAGAISEFPVPSAGAEPIGIASGPDGNLWFTETSIGKIGRMTTGGSAVEFATTTAASGPIGITAGADGNMWFTESNAAKIGVMSTSGTPIGEYPITAASMPYTITSGPDHRLWFAELHGGKIGAITTSGTVEETTIPSSPSNPPGIVTGADGAMWFVECTGNKIGRITTSDDITTEYNVPEATSMPTFITTGPDGSLWFTELTGNRIDGMTPSGVFTEYAIPTGSSEPLDVTTGPDGAIWFTEAGTGKIGRIR
jgi:virginiamycin B lyase